MSQIYSHTAAHKFDSGKIDSPVIENPDPNDPIAMLHQGWSDAIAAVAPEVEGIDVFLVRGASRLRDRGQLDESHLLTLVEAAGDVAAAAGAPQIAAKLVRRLRLAIYEYLLALDATEEKPPEPAAGERAKARADTNGTLEDENDSLIGAEEVALMARAAEPSRGGDSAAAGTEPEPEAEPIESDTAELARTPEPGVPVAGEPADFAVSDRDHFKIEETKTSAPQIRNDPKVAVPGGGRGRNRDLSVTPRENFHIEAGRAPTESSEAASHGGGGLTNSDYAELAGPGWTPQALDLSVQRHEIEAKLRKKRCDEASALLQQLAQEIGGREVADLAVEAGDRCRKLGKRQASTNCYLAACRADPVHEEALARLAEVCVADHDIDLAVSYLERIARLRSLRDDHRGALRIYRKIATIAPHRDDILEILMRADAAGRAG